MGVVDERRQIDFNYDLPELIAGSIKIKTKTYGSEIKRLVK